MSDYSAYWNTGKSFNTNNIDIDKEMVIMKMKLLREQIGWSPIISRMNLKKDPSCETMATDGRKMFYKTEWIRSIFASFEVKVARSLIRLVMLHETLHVALCHHTRRRNRDHTMWNIACDYAINSILISHFSNHRSEKGGFYFASGWDAHNVEHGLVKCLGGLYSPDFKGLSSETIYGKITKYEKNGKTYYLIPKTKESSTGADETLGDDNLKNKEVVGEKQSYRDFNRTENPLMMGGTVEDYTNSDGSKPSSAQLATEERMVINDVVTAEQLERRKKQGSGSRFSLLEAVAIQILEPQVDWQELLQEKLVAKMPSEELGFHPPSRRHIWREAYLPSRIDDNGGVLFWAWDVSGSVSYKEKCHYLSEGLSIFDNLQISKIYMIYVDTEVAKINPDLDGMEAYCDIFDLEAGDEVNVKNIEGGGTAFEPAFDFIEKYGLDEEIHTAIYFTDLYGDTDFDEPEYPVIWCTTGHDEADFGEVVKVSMN